MRGIYPVQTMRPIGLALRATLTRRFAATLSQRAPEGEGLAPNLFTLRSTRLTWRNENEANCRLLRQWIFVPNVSEKQETGCPLCPQGCRQDR